MIGVYTPDIVVPSLPFSLPHLAFFTGLEVDTPGQWDIAFRLNRGDTVIAGGSGKLEIANSGVLAIPIQFPGVRFQEAGEYQFTLELQGIDTPIQAGFSVVLHTPSSSPAVH